ncbi:hypothetical protein [Burkholderia gladioli]|uniref:hypothetical protein n=1 Tax=Burkholderia gladioli TaxID=28095 RepID=UPI00163FD889|nr:hypothetical protein [Burkholderia gladioli]
MIAIVCLVVGAAIVQANAQAANCVVAPFRRAGVCPVRRTVCHYGAGSKRRDDEEAAPAPTGLAAAHRVSHARVPAVMCRKT